MSSKSNRYIPRRLKGVPLSLIPRLGGKEKLIDDIVTEIQGVWISYPVSCFVEVFGGGARMLLNMPSWDEMVYNDKNRQLGCLMKCVQDRAIAERLVDKLSNMKHSRSEFEKFIKFVDEEKNKKSISEFDHAIAGYVLAKWSVLSAMGSYKAFSEKMERGKFLNEQIRFSFYDSLDDIIFFPEILKNVNVMCEEFEKVFKLYAHREEVLFYCDPPYLSTDQYYTGWTEKDRDELIELMLEAKCKILLSGYATDSYDKLLGWEKLYLGDFPVAAKKGELVGEYLWFNHKRFGKW